MSGGPVEQLWVAIQARDWTTAGEQLAEDVVIDWPATGERISGRDRYLDVQRAFPEGWSIDVRTLVHEGRRVAAEVRVPHGDEVFLCAAFYEVEGGMIARGVEHWSDGRPDSPPARRSHLTEQLRGR
jgi:hypothetical protein